MQGAKKMWSLRRLKLAVVSHLDVYTNHLAFHYDLIPLAFSTPRSNAFSMVN